MAQKPKTRGVWRRTLLKAAAVRIAVPAIPILGAGPPIATAADTPPNDTVPNDPPAPNPNTGSNMIFRTLGRTGLKVSVTGLGSGGFSRLGLSNGKTEAEAVSLIHLALDLGINLIDTAAAYGTEAVIGRAIANVPRDKIVITTKASPAKYATWERFPPETVVASIDNSLRQLGTDYLDVLQIHAVTPELYPYVRDTILPAVLREKEKGKLRFVGLTEAAPYDLDHTMFQRALAEDDVWDTAMVGFNMMHQGARANVFPATLRNNVGTLIMFAVRGIFAQPERLRDKVHSLAADGLLPKQLGDSPDPLGFLVRAGGAVSVIDAAYRYVRDATGVDVVLFGTGDPRHLREDIGFLTGPPLPEEDRQRIETLFGHLVGVGIEAPSRARAAPAAP